MNKLSRFTIEFDRETDGRWIADVLELPGVLGYGQTREEALAKVEALALRMVADQLDASKSVAEPSSINFALA